jgi:sugar lactone lactonase YvrE
MPEPVVLSDVACDLGESALWDPRLSRLYWVDITAGVIYARSFPDGPVLTLRLDEPVGSVALRASGGLIAAVRHGVVYCNVDTGTVKPLVSVESERDGNRFNDGAVDPRGRFWFGSMDLAETSPTGSFYRLGTDGSVTPALDGIICSNGPAWSLDGSVMYHVDSTRQRITAYSFDVETGEVGAGRLFASDEGTQWYPDGVTVDAEGFVWNCKWNGARIVRYAPDGTIDRVVPLPVPRPTRCAFIGPDLDQLAVTSARMGMSPAELEAAPLSGRVLLLDPAAHGLPPTAYGG